MECKNRFHVNNISVKLPNGKEIHMTVDGRTPMMDLLVQVTSMNGMKAAGMILKVPTDKPPGYLSYKPNTPIGVLNCKTLEVVPKFHVLDDKPFLSKMPKFSDLPFEPSIRIEIDLPENKKTILRVHPHTSLYEILRLACEEANLEPLETYELRGAKSHGYPLNLNLRLSDVGTVHFVITSIDSKIRKAHSEVLKPSNSGYSNPQKEKKKRCCLRSLFSRKKKKHQKSTTEATTVPEVQYSTTVNHDFTWQRTSVSFPSIDYAEYQVPCEPSPPAPLPPCRSTKRPAPPPPRIHTRDFCNDTAQYNSISDGQNIDRLIVNYRNMDKSMINQDIDLSISNRASPNLSQFEGRSGLVYGSDAQSYRSNILTTTPYESIRTTKSSFLQLSRPESMRSVSDTTKKRQAPLPPVPCIESKQSRAIEVQTNISLKESQSSRMLLQAANNETMKNSTQSINENSESRNASKLTLTPSKSGCPGNSTSRQQNQSVQNKQNYDTFHNNRVFLRSVSATDNNLKARDNEKNRHTLNVPAISITSIVPEKNPSMDSTKSPKPAFANVMCQTESIQSLKMADTSKGTSSIIAVEPCNKETYIPKIQVKSFEDEYYMKCDVGDYAHAIRYYADKDKRLYNNDKIKQRPISQPIQTDATNVLRPPQPTTQKQDPPKSDHQKLPPKFPSTQRLAPGQSPNPFQKKYLEPPVIKKATFQIGKRVDSVNSLKVNENEGNQLKNRKRTISEQGLQRQRINQKNSGNVKLIDHGKGISIDQKEKSIDQKNIKSTDQRQEKSIDQKIRLEKLIDQPNVDKKVQALTGVPTAPPPPPLSINLKTDTDQNFSKKNLNDRVDLMKSIRDFGGIGKLKKIKNVKL